ncbi:alpha/beta-hydrolase [Fistulina hepatica ATCC 64428]|uniref:triacylglycerol lipase n=1 Tax=Fistulina hepatica ATCC 64428 TaxID=1128425 RepID=A0A0D7ABG6_9AGAR|nr:alpha/beta-hydrolase [Fistulina hepatica ATCC 64428]
MYFESSVRTIAQQQWRGLSKLEALRDPRYSVFESTPIPLDVIRIYRPSSVPAFHHARFHDPAVLEWDEETVVGPDVSKRATLLELAKMTSNSYYEPNDKEWYDLGSRWNSTSPFGWEPSAAGFRGHVFVSSDNSTVVVSVKGTSVGFLIGGGPTAAQDKLNDNILFSCCCAHVGPTWKPVCPCYEGNGKCGKECLETSIADETLFYSVGLNLYNNVTYMYPNANIWLIGHSLGGSLASLIGATFGTPVVAFEAPAERMAARRLHLPSPPSTLHITHVYNTADPIPMGVCNGVASTCALAGYAMESRCHLGQRIIYDTVGKLGWSQDVRSHAIRIIIDKVLSREWKDSTGDKDSPKREVPVPVPEDDDCVDCFSWEFVEQTDELRGTGLLSGGPRLG